jgi:hypothetical protein
MENQLWQADTDDLPFKDNYKQSLPSSQEKGIFYVFCRVEKISPFRGGSDTSQIS